MIRGSGYRDLGTYGLSVKEFKDLGVLGLRAYIIRGSIG